MQDAWIGEAAPALAAVIDPTKLGTSLDDLRRQQGNGPKSFLLKLLTAVDEQVR